MIVPPFLFLSLEHYRFIENNLNEDLAVRRDMLPSYNEVDEIYTKIHNIFNINRGGINGITRYHSRLLRHSLHIFNKYYTTYLMLQEGVFKLWNDMLIKHPGISPVERASIVADHLGLKTISLITRLTHYFIIKEQQQEI